MMRISKPLFGTEKAVVMDNGFCVIKGIVGMLAYVVHGTTVINICFGPITSREIPLRHSSKTRELGMFMLFVVIWMGTSTIYRV